jgi:hypothetical protein
MVLQGPSFVLRAHGQTVAGVRVGERARPPGQPLLIHLPGMHQPNVRACGRIGWKRVAGRARFLPPLPQVGDEVGKTASSGFIKAPGFAGLDKELVKAVSERVRARSIFPNFRSICFHVALLGCRTASTYCRGM